MSITPESKLALRRELEALAKKRRIVSAKLSTVESQVLNLRKQKKSIEQAVTKIKNDAGVL